MNTILGIFGPPPGRQGSEGNLQNSRPSYQLLCKLPSDFFSFARKKRNPGIGFTSKRFFVLKSKYLLCYGKERSRELESIETYEELKRVADDEPIENVKRMINIVDSQVFSFISKEKYLINIVPKQDKPLILLFDDENLFYSWIGLLKSCQYSVSVNDFDVIREIGSGAFGQVQLCRLKTNNQLYAVKTVTLNGTGKDLLNQFIDERTIMQYLNNCDFIVHMECCFRSGNKLFYVLEYGGGGDLYSKLKKFGRLPENKVKLIATELILAIGHLHHMHVLHRDIKPENILIDTQGHIKLADFGLSKMISSFKGRAYSFCGTDLYRPPEMFTGTIGYTRALDWWQCGCVIYELLTGTPAFSGHKESRRKQIIEGEPTYPSYLSSQAVSLIKCMLTKISHTRLGAGEGDYEDILKHPFFNGIDIEKVKNREITVFEVDDTTDATKHANLNKTMSVHNTNFYPKEIEEEFNGFDYISPGFLTTISEETAYQVNNLMTYHYPVELG
ncbi:hypothetical protein WA158_000287 [Blastocystis sp. Blastoise]